MLQEPGPSNYQSRADLEGRVEYLTEQLSRSREIIHAHELIDEGQSAQLVVQHAILEKQNESLHAKENKKKADRTMISKDGMGRHLTAAEFVAAVQEQNDERDAEAAQKEQRRSEREALRSTRAALEVKWKETKAEHERAVNAWKSECEKLTAEGVWKKDLPRKPARPKKPQMPSIGPEMVAGRSDGESDPSSSDGE